MYKRVVYGSVAVLALLTAVASDAYLADMAQSHLVRRGSVLPICFTIIVMVGVFELLALLQTCDFRPARTWTVACCAVLMLSPWLCAGRVLGIEPTDVEGLHWQVIWLMVAFLGSAVVHMRRGTSGNAVGDLAATNLVIIYLGFLPAFAVQLRSDVNIGDPMTGAWTLFIVLMLIGVTDIAALFSGLMFGRHPLAPALSPKKTIEGSIGGSLGCIALMLGFWFASKIVPPDGAPVTFFDRIAVIADTATSGIRGLSWPEAVLFGGVVSIAAQGGDLLESHIKRCAQVKDSSHLIPGMGGVLDLIDSAIVAMPISWYLLTRSWNSV